MFHSSGDVRRTGFSILAIVSFALFFVFASYGGAATKEIRVLASDGVKAPVEDLRAQCERATGHPLTVEFDTAASLKSSIEVGKPFGVAILTSGSDKRVGHRGKNRRRHAQRCRSCRHRYRFSGGRVEAGYQRTLMRLSRRFCARDPLP